MRSCLQWDPDLRLTPQQALKHAWFCVRTRPRLSTSAKSLSVLSSAGDSGTGLSTVTSSTLEFFDSICSENEKS